MLVENNTCSHILFGFSITATDDTRQCLQTLHIHPYLHISETLLQPTC